ECHTVIFDPVFSTGTKLLGDPEEGLRLINVALSRAKARLIVILSAGDAKNETLRRVAQVIRGMGEAGSPTDVRQFVNQPVFPEAFFGTIVSCGSAIGPLEPHPTQGSFYVNDFRTGKRRAFKTEIIRANSVKAVTA